MTPDPEILGSEPVRGLRRQPDPTVREVVVHDGPLWHPPRWVWWALAVVVVVGTVGWYADHRVVAHERAALSVCEHRIHAATVNADLRLNSMADYIRPSLGSVSGARQHLLADLMARPARRVLPGVLAADRVCRGVSVRPWHVTLTAQRDALTAYSGALAARLQLVARSGRVYYHDDAALTRLRVGAGLADAH